MVTVFWTRGSEQLVTNRPNTEFICSPIRGGGKSSLLEHRGEAYMKSGATILDLFGCYDDQTELFTRDGFKLFKDITKEDWVASRTPEGYLEYYHPTAIQAYPYKGKMVQIGKPESSYNLLVTPDHNLYVQRTDNATFFLKPLELQEYIKTHTSHHTPFRIPKTAKWVGIDVKTVELPPPSEPIDLWKTNKVASIPIDAFLKVLGWYLSDGNPHKVNGGYRVEITKPQPEKQVEIRRAFIEMGFTPSTYRDRVYVGSKQLYEYFAQFGHAEDKFIPNWIKELPTHRLRILIETMLKGDGSRNLIYYTSSSRLWGDFTEIAIKAGYSVTTYQRPPRSSTMKDGRIVKGNYPEHSITVSSRDNPRINREAVEEVDYDGVVYDVTLPPHHTLLVRRKGKIVWCGNSRDGEGLAWLRSPWAKEGDQLKKIALIHGDDVDVTSSFNVIKVSKLTLQDFEKYDILISCTPLYPSIGAEYQQVNLITDLLYNRGKGGYKKNVYMIVREASNLYYSRLRIDRNQANAKAYMIYLIREARHMGLALGLDTLKFTSIDLDIRVLLDYIYFKGQGAIGLPDDYMWLYGFFKAQFIRSMGPSQFIILTKTGSIGVGVFPEVPWHKKERENIMKEVGVSVDTGDAINASRDMTRYETVDGKTHMLWMEHLASKEQRKRFGVNDEDVPLLSIRKIALQYERSPSTVIDHITKHDAAVQRAGYCPLCRSAGGKVYAQIIRKTTKR